jgi:hypothetical protein
MGADYKVSYTRFKFNSRIKLI